MLKKFLATGLCAMLAFSMCSCNTDAGTKAEYSLWGAPSSVKIMREDTDYANKRNAELRFDGVMGEYESYQLMITAESDIGAYSLEVSDLTGENGTFSAQNFEVYHEFYHYVSKSSTSATTPGYYPDALIPDELSIEAGENRIAKDCNQGIWVTVHIPAENTKPGVYSGSFTLTVDGEKTDIPVYLNIRNYVLPEESEQRTLFMFREQRMMEGEMDTSIELKEAYYEFFLDYRVNLNYVPMDSNDPQEFVESVKKYVNDDRVNTYSFPDTYLGGEWRNSALWKEWLYAFAENSSPECDLFKKLVWYYVDEPEGMYGQEVGTIWALNELASVKGMILDVYEEILADTSDRYKGLKQIEGWENYFLDPPTVVTIKTSSDPQLKAESSIWCPGWGYFGTQSERDYWMSAAEEAYDAGTLQEFWWYGCMGPRNPYPTYHLDDELMTGRIVTWLQQKYGITGNLYWSVHTEQNVYETPYFSGSPGYVDVNSLPTGDGYLVYPGARYNHFGPLPSMRLMSVRDGAEEFELLMDLEHKYDELKTEYEADYDSQELVSQLYERIADGTRTIRDADLFDEIRNSLLDTTIELNAEHGFLMDEFTVKDNVADVAFYVKDGFVVEYNGTVLSGGPSYRVQVDLTETPYLELSIQDAGGNTYEVRRFISKPYTVLVGFDGSTLSEGIRVNEGSEAALTQEHAVSGNALALVLRSQDTDYAAYKLRAIISKNAFETAVDFTKVDTVSLTVYNTSGFEYNLGIWLNASGSERNYADVTLKPGLNYITFNVANSGWNRLGQVNELIFEVENDTENLTVYNMIVDDIKFTTTDEG